MVNVVLDKAFDKTPKTVDGFCRGTGKVFERLWANHSGRNPGPAHFIGAVTARCEAFRRFFEKWKFVYAVN